jgi:hypothetical protein
MKGDHWMVGYATAGACAIISIVLLKVSFDTGSQWLRNGAFGSYVAAIVSGMLCFFMAMR